MEGAITRLTDITYMPELTRHDSWRDKFALITYVALSALRKLCAHLMKRRLKINGFIMFIAVLLTTTFPSIFFRHNSTGSLDEVAEILGITLILSGQIFRVSARGFKSEHSQNGRALIQGGPYALVRNPMYLGILLIGLGIVMVLFSWWVGCIFLLIFATRYFVLIFKEEKRLQVLFPLAYKDYCARVPRILPSLTMLFTMDIGVYLPLKLSWLRREIGSILAVLFIALFVESWEDIKAEGLRVYLREAALIGITIILFIGLVIYLSKRTESLGKDDTNKSKSN